MLILVINAGSSSLKYQLFDMDSKNVLAKGLCERIGISGGRNIHKVAGKEIETVIDMKTHADAIRILTDKLTDKEYGVVSSMKDIDAVGHRVLHGGQKFSGSVLVTPSVEAAIEECIPLGPLHNPANLLGIRACREVMGEDVPQVAVFDTAFHQTMPPYAFMYAIPYEYYRKYSIRRYGFHGTSHRYVSARAAELLGKKPEDIRVITCHLGNGSSLAAVEGGKCVDTSMGLTPLDGVPMGTRSGAIDPAILGFLGDNEGMSASELVTMLNKKSGVLGISEISSDFRDLTAAASEGNEQAALALKMFTYSVKKYIGSYAAAMGGTDVIVFTGGIGENNVELRLEILDGLEYMGVKLDPVKKLERKKNVDIAAEDSAVRVLIVETDEEYVIASDTMEIVKG